MNLFIDTNVFLSFYHLSSDDLQELNKLVVIIGQKKVDLFLPHKVIDEFTRNREGKISDALKRFKEERLNDQFPQMCKEYDEYPRMRKAIAVFKEQKSKLLEKLNADIAKETLKADKTISELFAISKQIDVTPEIRTRATDRVFVGNPPGKDKSAGDAINWECLLLEVPMGEDLFLISSDGDYASSLDDSEFSPFLRKEWQARKSANVYFYNRLSSFFKDKFPDIRLEDEPEKDRLIEELAAAPNFATTRKVLKQLVRYDGFTTSQLNDIVEAAIDNNQVYWIADDDDINKYLRNLIARREADIQPDALERFTHILEPNDDPIETETDEDLTSS